MTMRLILLTVINLLLWLFSFSLGHAQMTTLQKKRVIQMVETEEIPVIQQRIKDYTGMTEAVAINIDWESAKNGSEDVVFYLKNYLNKVANAIELLCRDELGKELLAGSLKQISLSHNPNVLKNLSYENGHFATETNWDDTWEGIPSEHDVRVVLENGL